MSERQKYYFWLGVKTGYIFNTVERCPVVKKRPEETLRYVGFTFDIGWPKRMNTGRILYKPSSASMKKTRKQRKKLG